MTCRQCIARHLVAADRLGEPEAWPWANTTINVEGRYYYDGLSPSGRFIFHPRSLWGRYTMGCAQSDPRIHALSLRPRGDSSGWRTRRIHSGGRSGRTRRINQPSIGPSDPVSHAKRGVTGTRHFDDRGALLVGAWHQNPGEVRLGFLVDACWQRRSKSLKGV